MNGLDWKKYALQTNMKKYAQASSDLQHMLFRKKVLFKSCYFKVDLQKAIFDNKHLDHLGPLGRR